MQWCCPDRQADEVHAEQQRKAIYVNSLNSAKLNSVNHTQHPNSYPNNYVESYRSAPPKDAVVWRSPNPSALTIVRERNHTVQRVLKERKIILWTRSNCLLERSQQLKHDLIQKDRQLSELTQQIYRQFPQI